MMFKKIIKHGVLVKDQTPTPAPVPQNLSSDVMQHLLASNMVISCVVFIWMASGGVVMFEPSPFELMTLIAIILFGLTGFHLYRSTLPLATFMLLFCVGGFLGNTMVPPDQAFRLTIYMLVTTFLACVSVFVANFVIASPHKHTKIIFNGMLFGAAITSTAGILGYFGVIPGADKFVLFDRAKGLFKDPNVFGPFLILPACYALMRILTGQMRHVLFYGALFGIFAIAIFLSFSRAAWGHLFLSCGLVFVYMFVFLSDQRQRIKLTTLLALGVIFLIVVFAAAMSIEKVRLIFTERASLSQDYDVGHGGRFTRYTDALWLGLQHPLGFGALQFAQSEFSDEEPHNSFLKALLAYGWLGFGAYIMITVSTLWRGLKALAIPDKNPNKYILLPVYATFIALVLESLIIDIDHWRHYFVLVGLIWGITCGWTNVTEAQRRNPL